MVRPRFLAALLLTALSACFLEDPNLKIGPSSEGGGSAQHPNRRFQRVALKVWKTDGGKLFYSLILGNSDFEPVLPTFTYQYSWNMKSGGTLTLNGAPVKPSPADRMLALNPFGELEELLLSPAEAAIVSKGDATETWNKVAVPRLYRFSGGLAEDAPDGPGICADAKGLKAYEGSVKGGKRDGEWTYYGRDGAVRAKLHYRDGKRDGLWIWYGPAGKETDRLTWKENVPVEHAATQQGLGYWERIEPNGSSQGGSY
jgi:hypothetical protein